MRPDKTQQNSFGLKLLIFLFSVPVILVITLWSTFALWYQLPGSVPDRYIVTAIVYIVAILAIWGIWRHEWRAVLLFTLLFVCQLIWWAGIKPSHDRIWADDVAQLLQAEVKGSTVKLNNVRNFDWHTESDYDIRWENREYDLEQLVSADLILSYWMGPAIAHTLISFGFADGNYLTFSVEIRKEWHESFSAIGGFFRRFETSIIAADERDIVRVRSNIRGEDVYLYRLDIPPEYLRTLFLGYAEAANELAAKPRFYNTLTSNCTTIVFDLAQQIAAGLPVDYRLLLSGYFADYVYDLGGLVSGYKFSQLRERGHINERALAADNAPDFSDRIRLHVPGITEQVLQ